MEHKLTIEYSTTWDALLLGNTIGVHDFRSSYMDYVKFMGFDETIDYYLYFVAKSPTDF